MLYVGLEAWNKDDHDDDDDIWLHYITIYKVA